MDVCIGSGMWDDAVRDITVEWRIDGEHASRLVGEMVEANCRLSRCCAWGIKGCIIYHLTKGPPQYWKARP